MWVPECLDRRSLAEHRCAQGRSDLPVICRQGSLQSPKEFVFGLQVTMSQSFEFRFVVGALAIGDSKGVPELILGFRISGHLAIFVEPKLFGRDADQRVNVA